jgi:hypothetical protein
VVKGSINSTEYLARPKWLRKEAQGACRSRSLKGLVVAEPGKEDREYAESFAEKLSQLDSIHRSPEVNVDKGKCWQFLLDERKRLNT